MDATNQDKEREKKALADLFDAYVTNPRDRAAFLRRRAAETGRDVSLNSSMVNQHLSGNRPISLDAALKYCRAFDVPLETVSARWARIVHEALPHLDNPNDEARPEPPAPPWPFPRVDARMIAKLSREQIRVIENEILVTADTLGVDVKSKRHVA